MLIHGLRRITITRISTHGLLLTTAARMMSGVIPGEILTTAQAGELHSATIGAAVGITAGA